MRRLRHSGETEASRSVAVHSHLTSWRPVFTFLILVLVNLQEIVNFNTEGRKGHKSSELRALLFRAEEEDVTSCRSAAANALSSGSRLISRPTAGSPQPAHHGASQAAPERAPLDPLSWSQISQAQGADGSRGRFVNGPKAELTVGRCAGWTPASG